MSKLHAARVIEKDQGAPFALPEQVEIQLHQLAGVVKEGLLAFSVGVGLNVLQLMMGRRAQRGRGSQGQARPGPHRDTPWL